MSAAHDAAHDKRPAAMFVLAEATPGRFDELVRWYREHHLGEVLAIPGFASAEQFVPLEHDGGESARVLTVFHFETADTDAPLAALSERRPAMTPSPSLASATVWIAHSHLQREPSPTT